VKKYIKSCSENIHRYLDKDLKNPINEQEDYFARSILAVIGGYSCWVVKDYRDTKNKIPYVPFHSDLARAGEEVGWKYHDLIIWDQTGQRRLVLLGYPSVLYTNQNCSFIVVFRKIK